MAEQQTLLDQIKATADTINALKQALDHTDRSVVVEIDNLTDHTLKKVTDNHEFGGFDQTPEPIIRPKSNSLFTSMNTVPFQGTEGSVTYITDGINDMLVGWNNPFISSPQGNTVNAILKGPRENRFELDMTAGSGNVAAHMRFVLFEKEGPFSFRTFLEIKHPDVFDFPPDTFDRSRPIFAFLRAKPLGNPGRSVRELMKV